MVGGLVVIEDIVNPGIDGESPGVAEGKVVAGIDPPEVVGLTIAVVLVVARALHPAVEPHAEVVAVGEQLARPVETDGAAVVCHPVDDHPLHRLLLEVVEQGVGIEVAVARREGERGQHLPLPLEVHPEGTGAVHILIHPHARGVVGEQQLRRSLRARHGNEGDHIAEPIGIPRDVEG